MPYDDNTWYHVTDRSSLDLIEMEGLVGRHASGQANFMVAVKSDAVYLWPELAAAEAWAARSVVKDPAVLRVTGLDQASIWPDGEAVLNWLAEVGDVEGTHGTVDAFAQRIIDELNRIDTEQAHKWAREVDRDDEDDLYLASYDVFNHVSFEDMLDALSEMDPALRAELARYIAVEQRSAVMHEGSIEPEQLERAIYNGPMSEIEHRESLNKAIREDQVDEAGVALPTVHQWHMTHDADVCAMYTFTRLNTLQPQLIPLSSLPSAAAAGEAPSLER